MLRFENAVFITMNGNTVFENGAMVVDNDHIVAIGNKTDIEKAFQYAQPVNLKGRLVLPGLINNHFHLGQTLFRGLADDMLLEPWLFGRIWPLQSAHDTETYLAGARLAMLEMMKSGTTTFVESMVIHYGLDAILEEVEKVGMRARLSKVVMEPMKSSLLPKALSEKYLDSLGEAINSRKKVKDPQKVDIWLGPRWTGMYNPNLIERVNEAMDEYGFNSTIHFAESSEDVECIRMEKNLSPGEFLKSSGMLDRNYLLIHCTWLESKDIQILSRGRATVAHCPVTAMIGSMGYADIPKMLEYGIVVGLGTDSPAANNSSDIFAEIKTAALLHKHQSGKPDTLPARQALELATSKGAASIFAAQYLGSLEAGKQADFITLDTAFAAPMPENNYYSSIAYSLTGRDVRDVFVAGRPMVRDGECVVYDEEKIKWEAREALVKLVRKANL